MPQEDCSKQKLLEDFCSFHDIKDSSKKIKAFLNKKENYITVYTDGSCPANGSLCAKAGIGIFVENTKQEHAESCKKILDKYFPKLKIEKITNQKAELMAIFRALILLENITQPIHIKTDSMYSINIFTKWYKTWIKNGWKTASGKPVENKEIISRILELLENKKVTFFHVEAHKSQPDSKTCYDDWYGNSVADKLASQAAKIAINN
jgi:ribonuclease HI